jgi:hypothetical protein
MDEQTQQQQQEAAGFTGRGFTGDEGGGSDGDDYGDGYASDPLIAGEGHKKKTKAPLVLILVVGLAIGSLFAMHTVTKLKAADSRGSEAEQIIDHFVKTMGQGTGPDGQSVDGLVKGHREVLDVLKENYTDEQVPNLDRDPFKTNGGGGGGEPMQVARYDYDAAAGRLSVKMIIMGSTPLANINGRIVKTNGAVMVALPNKTQVKFRVIDITSDTVTVQAEGSDAKNPFTKVLHLIKRGRGRRR